jgi:hypothetical protein
MSTEMQEQCGAEDHAGDDEPPRPGSAFR